MSFFFLKILEQELRLHRSNDVHSLVHRLPEDHLKMLEILIDHLKKSVVIFIHSRKLLIFSLNNFMKFLFAVLRPKRIRTWWRYRTWASVSDQRYSGRKRRLWLPSWTSNFATLWSRFSSKITTRYRNLLKRAISVHFDSTFWLIN